MQIPSQTTLLCDHACVFLILIIICCCFGDDPLLAHKKFPSWLKDTL